MADEIKKGPFGIRGKSFPVNTPEEIADALYQDYNMEAECQVIDAMHHACKKAKGIPRRIKGPYAGTKKALNRKLWEKDRKRRKAKRQAKRRNR
jgi:hypothetical protein